MRILITNDDGIEAEGIIRLARMARELGEVYIVAPMHQCSGMSQKVTIFQPMRVEKRDFPVNVMGAWCVDGTPCDCVKLAVNCILGFKPDYIFSGLNDGCNMGFDITYSGTMGAAFASVMEGIPAIAFSKDEKGSYDVCEANMLALTKRCIAAGQGRGEVWNLNFPSCPLDEFKGVLWDRTPAPMQLYRDRFVFDGELYHSKSYIITVDGVPEGTDIHAVLSGFISAGKVKSPVM